MIPPFRLKTLICLLLGFLLLLLGGASCSLVPDRDRPDSSRPNIIFVMTDDHTHHQMSITGNPLINTPNLDRLGREGVWVKNAFCTNSLCAPARATILTGTLSNVNGILGNSESKDRIERLNAELPTFPQLLRQSGYQTAIVGKWHLMQV